MAKAKAKAKAKAPKEKKRQHPSYHRDSTRCDAPIEEWRVLDRHCNYSKFSGSRYTPSNYSGCLCMRCGYRWRTQADYVALMSDAKPSERLR